jgi:phage shock protein A
MIREMEDTLVEIKAACAGGMAGAKKVERRLSAARARSQYWEEKAELAVRKNRDDLAREALLEKRRYHQQADGLQNELSDHHLLVDQYHDDIRQLEDKLKAAKEKQRILVQRHIHADRKRRAQEDIRRIDSSEAVLKFEELENRIERMEAEADLVNYGHQPSLSDELERLAYDEEIEEELKALKKPPKATGDSETRE